MSDFLDALERQLVDAASQRPDQPNRAPVRARGSMPLRLLVAAALLVLVTAAGVLALSASTSPPSAYAVIVNPDGSVTLTVNELVGVGPANARLAELGISVRLAKVEAGCTSKATSFLLPPSKDPAPLPHRDGPESTSMRRSRLITAMRERLKARSHFMREILRPGREGRGPGPLISLTIDPGAIPTGVTLILAFHRSAFHRSGAHSRTVGSLGLYRDPAPNCLPLPVQARSKG